MKTFKEVYPNAKEGDEFEVVGNSNGHGYGIGVIVKFRDLSITNQAIMYSKGVGRWTVNPQDVKPVQKFEYLQEIEICDNPSFDNPVRGRFLIERTEHQQESMGLCRYVIQRPEGIICTTNYARPIPKTEQVIFQGKTFDVEVDSPLHDSLVELGGGV